MTDTDTGRGDLVDEVAGAMADDATDPAPAADPLHPGMTRAQLDALAKLREPVPEHLLAVKPVDVNAKWNAQARKFITKDGRELDGRQCATCGQFLPERHGHLTYAGHAAITDRLLAADPTWSWEPVTDATLLAVLPRYEGGMWIWLTVAGVTRLGYGDAAGKTGHNAIKEIIGDALRNAAMRFGLGLELWHKGDLHAAKEAAERAETEAREAAEREARLEAAQTLADTAAGIVEPEQLAVLAERAAADGLAELTIAAPDGNAGRLDAYLRYRHRQLVDAAHAAEDGRAEAAQQAQQDEARAEQEALAAASESAAAEEAAQAHGAGGAGR